MKNKRLLWILIAVVIAATAGWFIFTDDATDTSYVLISPKVGTFDITVTTTGELQAKNSLEIRGPEGVRQQGIWQMKITKLVPEGTTVKPGDVVAELDQSEIAAKIRDAQLNIQKSQAEYTKTKLDTALTLAAAREELSNLASALEEKTLIKEQSVYEAPAIRKQVDLDYDRTQRQEKQAIVNYKTKVQQAVAKMQSVEADLMREQQKLQMLSEMVALFRITAPATGIVVYQREWNGKKRVVGSTVSPWDPSVATLPDLDTMESITYVNEVDIQKIQKGQQVILGLDSDPDKKLTGLVTSVANIGEQRPNSDSKVFEVRIIINERDTSLRPSMTTSNAILVSSIPQKMYVPLECLHSDSGRTFVYKQDGSSIIKQEVKVGMTNDNEAAIEAGIIKTDKLYLSLPPEKSVLSATVKLLPPSKDSTAPSRRQADMSFNINYTFAIAWQAIGSNKLRAMLTSLGIIFGVGSVISMLSVGKGAEQEILEQMKLLGANNIVIKPVIEQKEEKAEEETNKSEKKKYTPGLTLEDARSVARLVPGVSSVSPEIITELTIVRSGLKRSGRVVGIEPTYFEMSDFSLIKGELFNPKHIELALPVCIIGSSIRTKFFATEDPIGKTIKCGNIWLTVIGVLDERKISEDNIKHLGIRDYNMDIYTPITTALLKFRNRSLITKAMINNAARSQEADFGDQATDKQTEEKKNYHQLDRLTVRMASSENITKTAEIITRMLERRHNRVVDFEVSVPELLLKQEQRTKTIFNIVLGAIASISLLVGGIGIMNIMLASVLERTREIGIRRAIGARSKDITLQFLSEAVALCLFGGVLGIIFGVVLSLVIEQFTDIKTIVSPFSVIISFGVAVAVGLIFGIIPARRAALQNPIESLRYE